MRRVHLTVAYDGTGYHGWQFQPELLTVQGELQKALGGVLGEEVSIDGASRTDAGVHARGQSCAFTTATSVPTDKLPIVANRELPADIRVVEARDAEAEFPPRYDSLGKHYHYTFATAEIDDVFSGRYVSRVRGLLDIPAMLAAAGGFEGEHDFACLQNSSEEKSVTTVRRLFHVGIESPADSLVRIHVVGNAFLYNMVRVLAGMPITEPRLHAPTVMVNLLGEVWEDTGGYPDWARALEMPGVSLHLYGKAEPRTGRKMGHINVVADTIEDALYIATEARNRAWRRSPDL